MATHYLLEVLRAEGVTNDSSHLRIKRNVYIKVKIGNEENNTRTVERTASPEWNDTLTFSGLDNLQETDISIKLKQAPSLPSGGCIGVATVDLETLLQNTEEETRVELRTPRGIRASSEVTAAIFLRLRTVNKRRRVEADMTSARRDIGRPSFLKSPIAQGIATVGETADQVNNQKDLFRSLGSLLGKVRVFKELVDKIAGIHPYSNAAWQVIKSLYEVVQGQIEADQNVIALVHLMEEIYNDVNQVDSLQDKIGSLQATINDLLQQTVECCLFIRQYTHPGFLRRMISQGQTNKIDEFMMRFENLREVLFGRAILQTTFVSARICEEVNAMYLRDQLSPVAMDASNRPQCLPGTRTKYLDEIMGWLLSESQQNILWLHGSAGSGKSTVSMTISEMCLNMGRRGAYLFFVRGKSDPGTVIRTIAYSLSQFDQTIAKHISEAVKTFNDITSASMDTQFKKLLLEPLEASATALQGPVAIILDALDECGSPNDRSNLLKLIRQEFPKLPSPFRFIIASRSEQDLASALSQPHVYHVILQHASEDSYVDVHRYIERELQAVFESKGAEIPAGWESNIALLGRMAGGLFIWASTAMKQVSLGVQPFRALEKLLSYCRSSDSEARLGSPLALSGLYEAVLRNSGIQWDYEDDREDFCRVIGAILLSKEPLSVTVIDGLLNLPPESSSRFVISTLQSVLVYTIGNDNAPVRLCHTSFFDYLMAPERNGQPWYINTDIQRKLLAERCFDVMRDKLRFNICDLQSSFVRNDDVVGIKDSIERNVPPVLGYACRFWAEHLCDVKYSAELSNRVDFFARNQLLYWFEVLSLIKHFRRSAGRAVLEATLWTATRATELSSFLWDAYRLSSIFALPISESVPHIYISAVSLARADSGVAEHYSKYHPVVPVRRFGTKPPQPCMKLFTGHESMVLSVAFSPDGKKIASGSCDWTVRVWDAESGELVAGPFKGHKDWVRSVAFSPDGKRIASGSDDKTVRVWDAESGELIASPFQGHEKFIQSVAFSPDGKRIVSGSDDKTVRVWDAESGELVAGPFQGHEYSVSSVAFSPDGERIVSGSRDETVYVWNAESGKLVAGPFEGHKDWVYSVAFSPDGKLIASGSKDGTVRVWDAESGLLVAGPFAGHVGGVNSVSFSPDGKRIVSGSRDKTVRVWDAASGNLVAGPFVGHESDVSSVGFSPDGKRIVSGSFDKTIRVWDAESGELVAGPFRRHVKYVSSVAFSPDRKRIVSGSNDWTVCVWDAESGELVAGPFKGHKDWVRSVAFSPDGKRIASGSDDGTVRVWDAESGELVAGPFKGHKDWVRSVAFSPDGKRITSGSDDGTVRVWDAESGELVVGPFKGHKEIVNSFGFSSDREQVASGSDDRTVRVWNIEHNRLCTAIASGDMPEDELLRHGRRIDTGRIVLLVRLGIPLRWIFSDDGWLVGKNGELLLWIPPDMRRTLHQPRDIVVIGERFSTRLDFTGHEVGDGWHRGYKSEVELRSV